MKINLFVFWVVSNMSMLSCNQKVIQTEHSHSVQGSVRDVFPIVFADSIDLADSIVLSDMVYFYRKPFDLQERSKPVLDTIVSYLNEKKSWNKLIFRVGSNTGSEFAFGEQLIIMHEITSYFESKGVLANMTKHELEVSGKNKSEYWITIILK